MMRIQLSHEEGYVLASGHGVIDESACEVFGEHLHPLVGQPGTRLLFDLSDSDRITSAGLAELVRLVANANTNGSHVVLAACTPFVSHVFFRTGLDRFFELVPTISQGVTRLLG